MKPSLASLVKIMKCLIIDGYNAISKIEAFDAKKDISLEASRLSFIKALSDFRQRNRKFDKIIVVFDGKSENLGLARETYGNIEVLFSHKDKDADKAIVDILRVSSGKNRITVSSDDNFIKNHSCHIPSSISALAISSLLNPVVEMAKENSASSSMIKAETEAEKKGYQAAFIRDLRKHVRDISTKYILPDEGTMDFALMYIPSEPIYYEVVNLTELTEFARRSRVYPVSPNTLYANLQVILLSFQGKEIEKRTRQVFALMRAIQKDYTKISDDLSVLNRHVTNSYNQMANVNSGFALMGQKLSSTETLGEVAKEEQKQ